VCRCNDFSGSFQPAPAPRSSTGTIGDKLSEAAIGDKLSEATIGDKLSEAATLASSALHQAVLTGKVSPDVKTGILFDVRSSFAKASFFAGERKSEVEQLQQAYVDTHGHPTRALAAYLLARTLLRQQGAKRATIIDLLREAVEGNPNHDK
jgi:hypothetical protein